MHQNARNNTGMRLIVEQGIAHDLLHGSVSAWRFLSSHGVPNELILRVLSGPDRRRSSDNEAAHLFARSATGGNGGHGAPHSPVIPD